MIQFGAVIKKFSSQAEKTGWTYVEIPSSVAEQVKPGYKKSFRIKGRIENYKIEKTSILPSGNGDFILPLNKTMRHGIRKPVGSRITLKIEEDRSIIKMDADLMTCLKEEPHALARFSLLAPSHQRYFSKWISEAKTQETKVRRIGLTVDAMLKAMDFGETIRAARTNSKLNK